MIISIVIDPGSLRTNSRHIIARGELRLTATYRQALEHAALQVRQACILQSWRTTRNPVRVEMTTYWSRANADVDACVKATLDALQKGGVVADDKQVQSVIAHKAVDPKRPRIVVEIWELLV